MRFRGRGKGGRDRGFVEVGVAAAGALLVLGAVIGNGVAATILDMSDGQTWLPDDDGRVVQVNPATGEPERRLVVGSQGSAVEVSQRDGHLIVTDPLTGEITSIDLTGLVASGSRGSDSETWVLIGGGQVVLVEPSPGTVRAVDPLTLTDLGTPYRTDDLAHAVIDDDGSVWVLTTDGELAELDFAPEAGAFVVSTQRPVTGAGSASQLVPHSSGVTVFAPDGGAIVQVGTGAEVAVNVPALEGQVAAADRSDADLVPASASDIGRVFMLTDGQVLNVDVGSLGCTSPGAPAVLAERVYVPCLGAGRVIVLDADGARAGDDVVVPGGGDPQLLVDEGRLFVHSAGDDRIVLVQPDGSTQVVDIGGAEVPEHAVDQPAPPRPPANNPPQPPPAAPANAGQPEPPRQNTPPADRTQGPPEPDDGATQDSDVADDRETDQVRNDDDTDDSRQDDDGDDARQDEDDDSGDGTDDGRGDEDDADTGDGTDDESEDGAEDDDGTEDDDSSEAGDGDTEFTGPTNVQATVDSNDLVQVTWTAAESDVREHIVTSSDGSTPVTTAGDATSATLEVESCETSVNITVTAHLMEGDSASANTTVELGDCEVGEEPGPDPGPPTNVQATPDGPGELRVTWTVPEAAPEEYIVTSSDGSPARTVAGHRDSTNLAVVTCDTTVTITVTAYFPGGEQESASTTVDVPDCAPEPEPEPDPAPPTNVQASLQGDDEVRVNWTAPEAEVEQYIVTSSDGSAAQTVSGTSTSATLGVSTCGTSVTLTVTAYFDGGVQESATATVQAPDCPPAPGPDPAPPTNVSANLQGDDEVRVTWMAPEAEVQEYVVTSSDGSPAQTVSGTATTATLGMATCGTSVTITVTAHFSGGIQESATATVTAPACAPDPVQATAPTNVQAESLGGGQVRVTWNAASSGADTYVVYPSTGGGTDAGTATSVVLNLSPGTYTFTVETQLEGTQATSSPSGSVTVAGVPGAPGAPSVNVTGNTGSTVTANVSWPAASGNGATVTTYTITYSGGGVSGTTTTSGSTSTSLSISCGGQSLCTSGGTLNVTVTATNAEGTGGSANGSGTVPAPPPPPPANGDSVLQGISITPPGQGPYVNWSVNMSAPSTWANHSGTCVLHVVQNGTKVHEGAVPCGANYSVWGGEGLGGFDVTAYVTTTVAGQTVQSNSVSQRVPHRDEMGYCEYISGTGWHCVEPVSFPMDPDGNPDVEYIPAPWAPPEVPNPPVLAAGLGLLGLAGIVRALRNRAGLARQVLAGDGADPALSTAVGDPPR